MQNGTGGAQTKRERAGDESEAPQLMSWTALHHELLYIRREPGREGTMKSVATIGLDIAKNVFQVHGVDAGR